MGEEKKTYEKKIERELEKIEEFREKESQIKMKEARILELKNKLEFWQKQKLEKQNKIVELKKENEFLQSYSNQLNEPKKDLQKVEITKQHWEDKKQRYEKEMEKKKDLLLEHATNVRNKKRNLIDQIFTLLPMTKNVNEKSIYILEKKIPIEETNHYENTDATEGGVILGYLIVIAKSMAHCLLVDLPFVMQMRGSKSYIKKDQKEFVLNKDVNLTEFREGLRLLSENINFLCHSQGLRIPKKRRSYIASNLLSLKEWKDLGVESFIREDDSSNVTPVLLDNISIDQNNINNNFEINENLIVERDN
eukprot:TRINITY_DN12005_c0_g1_i1.p1 TRINITY_DN12005_c0_g1~~TRINITY_DN12005_c0_g1_i1.p1  ORF type:complete len:343 (-),score=83.45 TRINITY_DN12005_c0_g1_i1:81-1001(-)